MEASDMEPSVLAIVSQRESAGQRRLGVSPLIGGPPAWPSGATRGSCRSMPHIFNNLADTQRSTPGAVIVVKAFERRNPLVCRCH